MPSTTTTTTTARGAQAAGAAPPTSSPSAQPRPLLVVGSINQDVVLKVARLPSPGETLAASSMELFPGGKGCNQAAAAARLGHATSMIGRVGDDGAGRSLRAALEGAGVETSGVVACSSSSSLAATASAKGEEQQTPPPPTGTAVIMLQPDGENSIVIVGGANVEGWGQALLPGERGGGSRGGERGENDDSGNASSSAISVSPEFGALLLQREVPEAVNAAYARAAVASGVPVVLDAGGVDAPISEELLACVHTLSPNETELARLILSREDSSNGGKGAGGDGGKGAGGSGGDSRRGPRTESDAEVEAAARLLLSRSPASLSAVLVKRGGKGSMLVERNGGGGEGGGGGGQGGGGGVGGGVGSGVVGGVGGGVGVGGKGKGRASSPSSSPVRVFAQPAARVASVVDTTGAGDCFTAAYCVSWLREGGLGPGGAGSGKDREGSPHQQKVQQRLRFATAAAALCVSRAGALPSMPSLDEVESFLESGEGFR